MNICYGRKTYFKDGLLQELSRSAFYRYKNSAVCPVPDSVALPKQAESDVSCLETDVDDVSRSTPTEISECDSTLSGSDNESSDEVEIIEHPDSLAEEDRCREEEVSGSQEGNSYIKKNLSSNCNLPHFFPTLNT